MTELQTRRVVVTGIQVPFFDLTVLLVKWALASIPAALVLLIVGWLMGRVLVGIGFPAAEFFKW